MEKKEMSFADKFEAAGKELGKEIKDGCTMIMMAIDDEREEICANINGEAHKISALLAIAAFRDKNFKEILTNAIIGLEMLEKHNK